jgi:hypothetical protein
MEPEDEMDNYNFTQTLPESSARVDIEMLEWLSRLQNNRRLPNSVFYPLLVAYAVMIVFGVLANGLIVALVLRQRSR